MPWNASTASVPLHPQKLAVARRDDAQLVVTFEDVAGLFWPATRQDLRQGEVQELVVNSASIASSSAGFRCGPPGGP